MEFETIPTVPTADEVLDRSLRRAAAKKKLKTNVDIANEEFVRAVGSAIHDKLKSVVSSFPSFERLPPFYQEATEILVSLDRLKKSLGAVTWAADQVKVIGSGYARSMRKTEETDRKRKQAVARMASIVHQVGDDLLYLNEARNILRKLPHVSEDEFTVVVAGFPNVGKSSFINAKLLAYADEIKSAVMVLHGEKAHSRYFGEEAYQKITSGKYAAGKRLLIVPGATHCDLYDGGEGHFIPWNDIADFYKSNLL